MRYGRLNLPLAGLAALALGCAACDSDATGSTEDTTPLTDTVGDGTDTVDTVDPSPGLGIDYGTTSPGAIPRYEPASTDWTATGWPSDRFRSDEGVLDMSTFPSGPALFDTMLALAEQKIDGFGLNGAIYFQFDATLDVATLPDAAASRSATSPIQLVNVTAGSAEYGELMPLLFRWYEDGTDDFYLPKTLAIRPVYGFPLEEGGTYCAIITRAVQDAEKRYLQSAPSFLAALDDARDLAPLVAWLPDSPLRRDDLATATCFTTQHATDELRAISIYLDGITLPSVDMVSEPSIYNEFHGTYTAPNFQTGTKPYIAEGGDFAFDDSGDPIVQEQEAIRYLLVVPRNQAMPAAGWPIVMYSHGTTGDYESCRGVTSDLTARGLAVICMDQPLHGIRGPGLSQTEIELYSFNFVNPEAGRANFRQAAIDSLLMSRMIATGEFDLDGTETLSGEAVRIDPDKIYFFGHSHGGLSGALAMAVDPHIKGGVLSGAAGVMTETILRRKDPIDIFGLVVVYMGIRNRSDLDTFHPGLTLLQMVVDATDPINYSRYWLAPRGIGSPKSVFVTEGTEDAASPSVGTDAMTGAGDLPQILPLAKSSPSHDLRGIEAVQMPVTGNVMTSDGPRTAAMKQWQHGSHFVATRSGEARAIWRHFFETFVANGVPTLGLGDAIIAYGASTAAADTCATAEALPTHVFPIVVRGNNSLAGADHAATDCGDAEDGLGAAGRDVAYGFKAPAEGTYRFRITLPPTIDRDTPRYGPDLLYVRRSCGAGAEACVDHKTGTSSLDVELGVNEEVTIIVDGRDWRDKGPFTLTVDQRCQVLECGDRACGAWGCGDCGTCANGSFCDADGQCETARMTGDRCDDPFVIDALPFKAVGNTDLFVNDYGYDTESCPGYPFGYGNGSSDVAYRFTAATAGRYVATLGASFSGTLYVVGDCDDIGNSCLAAQYGPGEDERVSFELGAGETTFVIVDGAANGSNWSGDYALRVEACVPDCAGRVCGDDGCGGSCGSCDAGDSCVTEETCEPIPYICTATAVCETIPGNTCESAIPVDALPFSDTQDTGDFHPEYGTGANWCEGDDSTRGFGAPDVAYSLTVPETGLYRFGVTTVHGLASFDAHIYLVEDSCEDLQQMCLAADERDRHERIWRELDKDDEVFLIVDGDSNFSEYSGLFDVDINRCVPTCEDRECGGDGCIGSCGGCDEKQACIGYQCRDARGLHCDAPIGIGRLPWTHNGDTEPWEDRSANVCDDNTTSDDDNMTTGDGSPDVTYLFKAPEDGIFRFTLTASWDAQLYMFTDCGDVANSCLGEGRDVVDLEMAKDDVIRVVVDGAGSTPVSGAYSLRVAVACFPECDGKQCGADGCGGTCGDCNLPADICTGEDLCVDPLTLMGNTCANPFSVGSVPFEGSGDTTFEAWNHYAIDEAQCARVTEKGTGSADQVWRFSPAEAGTYEIEVVPDGWDAALYVVEDCDRRGTTCLGADDGQLGERVVLDLGVNQTVFIVVDGEDNVVDDAGAYQLFVRAAP